MGKQAEDGTSPFWGRAAVMGVVSKGGYLLERNSIEFPHESMPLMRKSHPDEGQSPTDIIGFIHNVWYGDESGLQVILFDGVWITPYTMGRDFLEEYPDMRYPAMFINGITRQNHSNHIEVKRGMVRSMFLTDGAAHDGLFIRSEPLPELLQNRGRM